MMKPHSFYLVVILAQALLFPACNSQHKTGSGAGELAGEVKELTLQTWKAYKTYAWGSDVLLPISKGSKNWYSEPLYISPIDAYSTLHLMGFYEETGLIERYVMDSLDFDKDIFVKVFEVNIRVLGGLLSMYQASGNPAILAKAKDFADRLMPAFNSGTGIPHYWVNLHTGVAKGDTVNIAETGTYTMEMGILSYYTGDPTYYQKAKRATSAAFDRRSTLGLIGERIDIESGEWTNTNSHICAGKAKYRKMVEQYFSDIKKYCRTDVAFTAIENVKTMEKRDYMATYFLAETLKYLYLTFLEDNSFSLDDYVFTTEAHTFRLDRFDENLVVRNLGIQD